MEIDRFVTHQPEAPNKTRAMPSGEEHVRPEGLRITAQYDSAADGKLVKIALWVTNSDGNSMVWYSTEREDHLTEPSRGGRY